MPSWLIFLLVLSVLVLIHELGHFIASRLLGIKVEEFAFGLPFTKPLLSLRRGETQYSVYPLLFGGFVRLYGEESEIEVDKSRSFWSRGRKQRMAVIVAGVVMNIALALVSFVVLYSVVGVPLSKTDKVTVIAVEDQSPADVAGLAVNDRVIAVEDKAVADGAEFSRLMRSWAGIKVNLTVERGLGTPLLEGIAERGTKRETIVVTPRLNPPEGQGPLGVRIADFPYLQMRECSLVNGQCVVAAARQGVITTANWVGRVVEGLRSIGQNLLAGKAPEGVAGPIGIYQLTDVVSQGGFLPILELTAVLSVNLAVFNVLPIPALDGGRLLFIWLEFFRRKRLPAELEQKINSWGMIALIGLLALISLQDVFRLGWISQLLDIIR
ncbi:MAG: M50 family metallopeptidase [bacterium]|nr:M50 family metallopeptidase [bacterium]